MKNKTDKNKAVFDEPVTLNGQEVQSVVLRTPKVADMRAVDRQGDTDLDKEVLMIGRLIGVPAEELDELSVQQYKKLQDVYASFFS